MALPIEIEEQFDAITKLLQLPRELGREVIASREILGTDSDSQLHRRSHFKITCSFFEGTLWTYKQLSLIPLFRVGKEIFTTGELAALEGKTFVVNEKGEVRASRMSISAKANFRFTFSMLEKALGVKLKVDYRDNGWNSLQKTIDVRNRITHPKSVSELHITDKELDELQEAINWLRKIVQDQIAHSLEKAVEEFQRSVVNEYFENKTVVRNRFAKNR